jgi:hypothetical protein
MKVQMLIRSDAISGIDDMKSRISDIAPGITVKEMKSCVIIECYVSIAKKVIDAIAHHER